MKMVVFDSLDRYEGVVLCGKPYIVTESRFYPRMYSPAIMVGKDCPIEFRILELGGRARYFDSEDDSEEIRLLKMLYPEQFVGGFE